jgi:hypothetical protein
LIVYQITILLQQNILPMLVLPSTLIPDALEVHYYLENESHEMDAIVRHRCETEILYLIKEISASFDLELNIVVAPPVEGGFRDKWRWLAQNKEQLQLLSPYAVIVLMQLLTYLPKPNTKLEKLQEESIQLNIEEKRSRLERFKKNSTTHDLNTDELLDYFGRDHKIIKHRSNFYTILNEYEKINKVSSSTYFYNTLIDVGEPIAKSDFSKFIVKSDKLPSVTIDDAIVEIISPVLKRSKFKWKGIYNGETIDFSMVDNTFKNRVINKQESFENGDYIRCKLEIKRKINEFGDVQNISYRVVIVTGRVFEEKIIETERGKRLRHEQTKEKVASNQTRLF